MEVIGMSNDNIYNIMVDINRAVSKLSDQDAESHIWYNRFRDMVKKYAAPCPACNGEGYLPYEFGENEHAYEKCFICKTVGYIETV